MTLTYNGYDIAALAAKYGDSTVPRIVEGQNGLDSIAGSHEPDPLAYKTDLVVNCRPLSGAQVNLLHTLMAASIAVPYGTLLYVSGDVTLSGQYRISATAANNIMDTSERKLYGGVVLTFTQR